MRTDGRTDVQTDTKIAVCNIASSPKNCTFYAYCMYFVFTSEPSATSALYNTNLYSFITEIKNVYCAVRTGLLNKTIDALSLKR
jgi:hypothetical protein